MNKIPEGFDLDQFVGEEIEQICIDKYQIQLKFENLKIQGGGSVSIEKNGTTKEMIYSTWKTCDGLENVIGEMISSWKKRTDFEFELVLNSKATLIFKTKESEVEDFVVWFRDKDTDSWDYWLL